MSHARTATAPRGAAPSTRPGTKGSPQPASSGPRSVRDGARTPSARGEPPALPSAVQLVLSRSTAFVEAWAPTAARVLLGLVLAWFGYHELIAPGLWTGYVPVFSATSRVTEVLVLAHGWVLLVLAVAIVAGVAPRLAAVVVSVLLFEIVVSFSVSAGLSDLVLRDVGVLGLSIAVAAMRRQRLCVRG